MWMREKDENEEEDDDRRWWWLIRRTTTSLAVWEMSMGQMENMQRNISACHGFLFNCRCEDYTGYPASYQTMDQWSQLVLDWNQKYNLSMIGSTLTGCIFFKSTSLTSIQSCSFNESHHQTCRNLSLQIRILAWSAFWFWVTRTQPFTLATCMPLKK